MKPWKITDEVMEVVVKNINATFHNLKIDELNIIGQAKNMYARLNEMNRTAYRQIAVRIYRKAYKEATGEDDNRSSALIWLALTAVLTRCDPVSKYVYDNEVIRKKDRFSEAMTASDRTQSIIRSRNLWLLQTLHYGDVFTLEAMRQAYKDAGVEYLQWHTQEDNRVCKRCEELNGKVFKIDDFPPPQHYHCRCYGTIYRQ